MTKIKYIDNGQTLCLIAEGHSGYAEQGKDIVCAGISTLIFTLANIVEEQCKNNYISLIPGKSEIRCSPTDIIAVRSAYVFALTGLRLIQEQFPNFCRIENDAESPS